MQTHCLEKEEKVKRVSLLFLMLLLIVPSYALSEEVIEGENSQKILDEVVVSATKTEEKRKDVSNAIVVKDSFDIDESAVESLGELLANESGVDWRTYGNYGGASHELQIRGMDGAGTQVMVNGVVMNSPSLGTANISGIPLNAIDRVEVIKGAGSLLHGSGAMGGIVSVLTKRPEHDKVSAIFSAGYGSEDTYRLSAEQGMYLGENFGYYITANRRKTDGFRVNSKLRQNDVSLKMILDKGDALDISLYSDYIDREFGQPGVQPPKRTADHYVNGAKMYNNEAASLVNHHGDEESHSVLDIKSKVNERINLSIKGDYTSMKSYNYLRYNSSGTGVETWVTNRIYGIEGNADIEIFENASILIGAERKEFDYDNEMGNLDQYGESIDGSKSSENYTVVSKGLFAELQYQPFDFCKVLAGIRRESNSKFGTENVFRYGLIINPVDGTVIKLSSGKHFAAPTMNDLFWPDDGFSKGNSSLTAETGWHSDITYEQSLLDDKLFFTCSIFHWDIEDKINWVETTDPAAFPGYFYWSPSNVDDYNACGAETGIQIGPFYNTVLSVSYTYTDAEEKRQGGVERQAQNTSDHQFKGDLSYIADFGMSVKSTIRLVGDRPSHYAAVTDDDAENTLDSYWTWDMKIKQRLFERWIFSLQGNNLLNTKYYTNSSRFYDQKTFTSSIEDYPGAGRSLFFNVMFEY